MEQSSQSSYKDQERGLFSTEEIIISSERIKLKIPEDKINFQLERKIYKNNSLLEKWHFFKKDGVSSCLEQKCLPQSNSEFGSIYIDNNNLIIDGVPQATSNNELFKMYNELHMAGMDTFDVEKKYRRI